MIAYLSRRVQTGKWERSTCAGKPVIITQGCPGKRGTNLGSLAFAPIWYKQVRRFDFVWQKSKFIDHNSTFKHNYGRFLGEELRPALSRPTSVGSPCFGTCHKHCARRHDFCDPSWSTLYSMHGQRDKCDGARPHCLPSFPSLFLETEGIWIVDVKARLQPNAG